MGSWWIDCRGVGWGGVGDCKKCIKGGGMNKSGEKTKILKRGWGILNKGVGTLKREGV